MRRIRFRHLERFPKCENRIQTGRINRNKTIAIEDNLRAGCDRDINADIIVRGGIAFSDHEAGIACAEIESVVRIAGPAYCLEVTKDLDTGLISADRFDARDTQDEIVLWGELDIIGNRFELNPNYPGERRTVIVLAADMEEYQEENEQAQDAVRNKLLKDLHMYSEIVVIRGKLRLMASAERV